MTSARQNADLQVQYPSDTELPTKVKPAQTKAIFKKPDAPEKKDDLTGTCIDKNHGDSVQDMVGVIAFALKKADVTEYSRLKKKQKQALHKYKNMVKELSLIHI